jgi:KDO2-lipid IV(A) lauroyltransferase
VRKQIVVSAQGNYNNAMEPVEKSKLKRALEYFPVLALLSIGRLIPFRIRGKIFAWLGGFIVSKLPSARKRVVNGLGRVFPDLSPQEVKRITRDVGRNTAQTLSEILMNDDYKKRSHLFTASGPGLKILEQARDAGTGAIIVSAHFGQWEAIRHHLAMNDMETGAVYRENNNPLYERRFRSSIEHGGAPIVARSTKGNMKMVRHLRGGGFFALLVDQKYLVGTLVPFLGIDAMTTTAPAELALRYNLPLVPAFATRQANGMDIAIEYEAAIAPSNVLKMTTEINERIGERIKKDPAQWYWLHNRWQLSRIEAP